MADTGQVSLQRMLAQGEILTSSDSLSIILCHLPPVTTAHAPLVIDQWVLNSVAVNKAKCSPFLFSSQATWNMWMEMEP